MAAPLSIQDGAKYDLMIPGIAALSLILLIMMILTRSLVAAFVIVGTVAFSLGASFGLSVLVWQYMFGIQPRHAQVNPIWLAAQAFCS
jgi:RND superfamily putative drug exporter